MALLLMLLLTAYSVLGGRAFGCSDLGGATTCAFLTRTSGGKEEPALTATSPIRLP